MIIHLVFQMNKPSPCEGVRENVKGLVERGIREFDNLVKAHHQGDHYRFFHAYSCMLDAGLQLHSILEGRTGWQQENPPAHVLNWLMGETELRYFVSHMLKIDFERGSAVQERIMDWFLFLVEGVAAEYGPDCLPSSVDEITMVLEARLQEHALQNFRPVWGIRGIFRSSMPNPYQEGPAREVLREWYKENNIKTLIDLRRPEEVTRRPNDPVLASEMDIDVKHISFNIPEDVSINAHEYVKGLILLKDEIRDIFKSILDSPGSTQFHCVAGKDRTGIIAALIQLLAGISHDKIIEDYIKSGHDTRVDRITQTLKYIKENGGIKEFLEECGFSIADQDELLRKIKPTI